MGAYNGNPANIDTHRGGYTGVAGVLDVIGVSSEFFQLQQHCALGRCTHARYPHDRDSRRRGGSSRSTTGPCARVGPRWGYLYLGLSVGAVVAEGILRGQDIPPDLIIRKRLLAGKSLTELVLDDDVDIAVLDGQRNLIRLGQDASLSACTWRDYGQTRRTATDLLPRRRGCATSADTDETNSR